MMVALPGLTYISLTKALVSVSSLVVWNSLISSSQAPTDMRKPLGLQERYRALDEKSMGGVPATRFGG